MDEKIRDEHQRDTPPHDAEPPRSCESASQDERVDLRKTPRPKVEEDEVDEASMESFPCSDPPGYYSGHA